MRRQGCLFSFSCHPETGALDTHSSRPPCPHRTRDRCHLTPGFPLSFAGAGGPVGGNSQETPRNRQAEPRRSKWDGQGGAGADLRSPSPARNTPRRGKGSPRRPYSLPDHCQSEARHPAGAGTEQGKGRARRPNRLPHSAQANRHCARRTPQLPHPATGRLRCHRPRRPSRHSRTANQGGRGPAGRGD